MIVICFRNVIKKYYIYYDNLKCLKKVVIKFYNLKLLYVRSWINWCFDIFIDKSLNNWIMFIFCRFISLYFLLFDYEGDINMWWYIFLFF